MRKTNLSVLGVLVTILMVLAYPPFLQAESEISTKTVVGNFQSRPVDVLEYYRSGNKIMATLQPAPDLRICQVFYRGQVIAKLTLSPQGIFKQALLGNQLAREISLQWFDKNSDGVDDYLLVALVGEPGLIDAYLLSPEKGLLPLATSQFAAILTPRALPVVPPEEAKAPESPP